MRFHEILKEEVYGRLAVAYHRTKSLDLVGNIGQGGFQVGGGALYGPGVYLTYDLASQMNERMVSLYGPYIVRCKVNLDNFLIFDQEIAQKVYGFASVTKQFIKQKWTFRVGNYANRERTHDDALQLVHRIDNQLQEAQRSVGWGAVYTASLAKMAYDHLRLRGFSGMVFTGRSDGSVIVAYDTAHVIPFAYAMADDPYLYGGGEIEPNRSGLPWHRIDSKALLSRGGSRPQTVLDCGSYRWIKGTADTYLLAGRDGNAVLSIRVQQNTHGEMAPRQPNPEPGNKKEEAAIVSLMDHLIRSGVIAGNSSGHWSGWYEDHGLIWRDGRLTNIYDIRRRMIADYIGRLRPVIEPSGDWGDDYDVDRYAFDTPEAQVQWMNHWAEAVEGTSRQDQHLKMFLQELSLTNPDNPLDVFDFADGRKARIAITTSAGQKRYTVG